MSADTITGRVSIAQEDRFLLEDKQGGHRLFLLAHNCRLTPQDLRDLCRRQQRIRVHFSSPQGLIAAVAHSIEASDGDDHAAAHGLPETISGFFRGWPLLRQIAGQSARSDAARSSESERLRPRLRRPISRHQHLPVLRGRLRSACLCQGRQSHPCRRRSAQPDQPGHALPEGRGDARPAHKPVASEPRPISRARLRPLGEEAARLGDGPYRSW